eukprot:scaffold85952_cov63-Phaeocystis_antarctica.AAC.1
MDDAPVSTAAVASSRPREDAEQPHPPMNVPGGSYRFLKYHISEGPHMMESGRGRWRRSPFGQERKPPQVTTGLTHIAGAPCWRCKSEQMRKSVCQRVINGCPRVSSFRRRPGTAAAFGGVREARRRL